MASVLRDPIWQFLGVIAATLAILVTLFAIWLQRKRKKLVYQVICSVSLLHAREQFGENLLITYNENKVENPRLVLIRIQNASELSILPSDFEHPLSVEFGENSVVMSAEVFEQEPKDISASVGVTNNVVVLDPVLLNSGDSISIKILVDGYGGDMTVKGRVVGVKSIDRIVGVTDYRFAQVATFVSVGVGFCLFAVLRWLRVNEIISFALGMGSGFEVLLLLLYKRMKADLSKTRFPRDIK